MNAVSTFMNAYHVFSELIARRRRHQVPSVHFAVITNALVYDDINEWRTHVMRYIAALNLTPKDRDTDIPGRLADTIPQLQNPKADRGCRHECCRR